MPPNRRRKPQQHDIEAISRDQLCELLHHQGWVLVNMSPDYGEDYLVRIFEDGNNTGHDFYVQVKGTLDASKHALKSGDFRYTVDIAALHYWSRNVIPTIFILWDINKRTGHWLLLGSYIEQMLQQRPDWLDSGDGQRTIHVPCSQELTPVGLLQLHAVVRQEFESKPISKQALEQEQSREVAELELSLETSLPSPDDIAVRQPQSIRIRIQQQAKVATLEALVAVQPVNADLWAELASLYYSLDEFDRAISAINTATNFQPLKPGTLWIKACILTEYAAAHGNQPKSMLIEALALFMQLRKGTDAASANYNIGNTLMHLGRYSDAITSFDQALTSHSEPSLASEIWKNRGTCYFHQGDHEEEFRSYNKAIDLWPTRWQAFSSWAVTDMRLGNFEHARDMLLNAMSVNPDLAARDASHLYWLAFVFWKLGDISQSYLRVNQVLMISPQHERAWLLKARLLGRLWRNDGTYVPSAITFFQTRIIDRPDDIYVRRELYLLLSSEGQQTQAQVLAESMALPPDASAQALFHYAAILADEGRVDEAIQSLEIAVQKSRDHNIVHTLAKLKQKMGRYIEAVELYKTMEGDEAEHFWADIADCYYFLGVYLEALRYCARLAFRDPDNERWWNNLSLAAMQLNKPSVALLHDIFFRLSLPPDLQDETWRDVKIQTLMDVLRSEIGNDFVASVVP